MATTTQVEEITAGSTELETPQKPFGDLLLQNIVVLNHRARHLTGNRDEAWDLVQDTLERALTNPPPHLRPESLRAWLLVVMRNMHLDRAAAKRRRPHVPIDSIPTLSRPQEEDEENGDDPEWADLTAEDVREGCTRLSPELGSAYNLYTFEGCSYAEVAARLNVRPRTVGSRVFRARKNLRRFLEQRIANRKGAKSGALPRKRLPATTAGKCMAARPAG